MIQNQRFYQAFLTRDFEDLLKIREIFMISLKIKFNLRAKSGRNSFLEKMKKKLFFWKAEYKQPYFVQNFTNFTHLMASVTRKYKKIKTIFSFTHLFENKCSRFDQKNTF